MLDFDASRLRTELADLGMWQVAAFAAACVEVLSPAYRHYCDLEGVGDPALVDQVLGSVWRRLDPRQSPDQQSQLPPAEELSELLPQEEDWNEWAPQAEDAISAMVMLLELLENGDITLAASIAARPYGGADELAARQMDLGVVDAAGRQLLMESAPVQRELERQARALRMLRESPDREPSVLDALRQSAQESSLGGL